MTPPPRYRIHPAIGIARVGNAPASEYFLGPEVPNQPAERAPDTGTAVPPFKSDGLVKRQAARFRVFEYVQEGGLWTASREVSLADDDVVELTWTVHLANRKASFFQFLGLDGSPDGKPNTQRRNDGDQENLEIDPLPRSVGGHDAGPVAMSKGTSDTPAQERWPRPAPSPPITSLGELRTDQAGRLIVVPGAGIAGSQQNATIDNYANNPSWFDDVGDGPVTATIKLRSGDGTVSDRDVEGAWLLVGPPDFAPPLPQLVSLYDVLLDLAVQHLPIPSDEAALQTGELASLSGLATLVKDVREGTALSTYTVSFDTDVAPILRAAFGVSSVFEPAHQGKRTMGGLGISPLFWKQLSDPESTGVPGRIVGRLRPPLGFGATAGDNQDMPHLRGDDPYNEIQTDQRALTLTPTQYAILRKWSEGDFIGSALGPESLLNPPQTLEVTPHGLDRAAIECASGGAFYPGIEVGWLIRQPWVFAAPFRIKHGAPSRYHGDEKELHTTIGAGYFSRQMAVPWLADFLQCMHEGDWGWWPSQRPDSVQPPTGGQRVPWHRSSGPDGVPKPWPKARTGLPENRDQDTPSYDEMLENWFKFGFVMPIGEGQFGETERADRVP